jgi:hypothetical protein
MLSELSESGVQVVGKPQWPRLLRVQGRECLSGRWVAACGSFGVLHVVLYSANTHLYLRIRPAVKAP